MGDSDDFKMHITQPLSLDLNPDNHPEMETLPPNHSQSGLENDGLEPKEDETDHEIDVFTSDDENLPQNNTTVENVVDENDIKEPNNNAKHAIIEIFDTIDENIPQTLKHIDNDDVKQYVAQGCDFKIVYLL